jgi:pimeloyl-ACP methyl ester carboxylesterase
MGGQIAKLAFMPPPQEPSRRHLQRLGGVEMLDTSEGVRVAFKHFRSARPPSDPARRFTVLYCHGNAEDLAHGHDAYQDLANRISADVFAWDYPGYSLSEGTPTESGAFAGGEAMLEYILVKQRVPRDRVVLAGRSLGSGTATHLASQHRGLAGLILIAPLKSCCAIAGSVAYACGYAFDIMCNIRKIAAVRDYPVVIFHGDQDTVVPFEHGKALYEELAPHNKHAQFVPLAGAGHNDIEMLYPQVFFQSIATFIAACDERRKELQQNAAGGARGASSSSSCTS